MTPAAGEQPIRSTSHTTIDLEKALRVGYAGLRVEIHQRLDLDSLDDAAWTF